MKRNQGFTLIELLVTILSATLVIAAASTVFLVGLRLNRESTDTAKQQSTANIVMNSLSELAAEKCADIDISVVDSGIWKVLGVVEDDGSQAVLFSSNGSEILLGTAPVMTIKDTEISLQKQLLTIQITMEDDTEYVTSVFCRLAHPDIMKPEETPALASSTLRMLPSAQIDRTPDLAGVEHAEGRETFLAVLTAEEGSTGASLTTGEYFSEWYIGGYAGNPSWNADTPWCACFLSWALDRCGEYLNEVPKFAHVDKFMNSFPKTSWKTRNPDPGDVIFFDWIENDTGYPQHVGVVLKVTDTLVCTIEGNTDNQVAVRQYALDDPRILGYGVLNWK